MLRTGSFKHVVRHSAGMTCVDLGAILGKFTRARARSVKHVIAFEPDPWTYAALEANAADFDNMTLHRAPARNEGSPSSSRRHARFRDNPALHSEASSTPRTTSPTKKRSTFRISLPSVGGLGV